MGKNKTEFKNFPMVPRVVYGAGSIQKLEEILYGLRRKTPVMVFLIDDVFENNTEFLSRLPNVSTDHHIFIDTRTEPKTEQVDKLTLHVKALCDTAVGIIGIGGGSVMDLAKAVSIMLTNPGCAHQYQGWDLVPNPAAYHVGIPTISGTGAEVSRTTVLNGPRRKLGINSDYTPFDQVILDPDLSIGVAHEQWFYTGMDCFIHSVESLNGTFLNAFSRSYGEMAYGLCTDIFLNREIDNQTRREKLMMASWHGGMSIAYSQVGIAHALSYGLSYIMGIHHGIGNCLIFNKLQDYYAEHVEVFREMMKVQHISLPTGIASGLSDKQKTEMVSMAMSLEPLWENALGAEWKNRISFDEVLKIYDQI